MAIKAKPKIFFNFLILQRMWKKKFSYLQCRKGHHSLITNINNALITGQTQEPGTPIFQFLFCHWLSIMSLGHITQLLYFPHMLTKNSLTEILRL